MSLGEIAAGAGEFQKGQSFFLMIDFVKVLMIFCQKSLWAIHMAYFTNKLEMTL